MTIDDLIGYYKRKNRKRTSNCKNGTGTNEGPISSAQRSLSTQSESIDNFIQYEGCSEVDWTVPQILI